MKFILEDLWQIEKRFGYLPRRELESLAEKHGKPLAEIFSVASFYSLFSVDNPPKHFIGVCTCPSCIANGALEILHAFEEELGVSINSDEGDIRLLKLQCQGRCDKAPVVVIDGVYYEKVRLENIEKLIEKCR
ncbi:NAD(P)H-dependent oxidoreductase subunit E [Candidatus Woesearchaeota archaeon]|nr:NAD(P)H-dependent oxidoreductase subunit E [Candidatus Woesearchaeota archaeon]